MKFGSFNPATGQPYYPVLPFINQSYRADIGSIISLLSNESVHIKDLLLDGNIEQMTIGGQYGDIGYQLRHYGIQSYSNQKLFIENLTCRKFGTDGMIIGQDVTFDNEALSARPVSIINTICEYNGRQGLSIVGGKGFFISNCSFNYTGYLFLFGVITGEYSTEWVSAPGSGIDIEAEAGIIRDVEITNCEFISNKNVGILSTAGDASNVIVKNCLIWARNGLATEAKHPSVAFIDCKFYGSVSESYSNDKLEVGKWTRYISCVFEDKDLPPVTIGEITIIPKGNNSQRPLISNNGCIIEGCTFIYRNANPVPVAPQIIPFNANYSAIINSTYIFEDSQKVPDGEFPVASVAYTELNSFTIINNAPTQPLTPWYVSDAGLYKIPEYAKGVSNIINPDNNKKMVWMYPTSGIVDIGPTYLYSGVKKLTFWGVGSSVSPNFGSWWNIGDKVFTAEPSTGMKKGWICVASGDSVSALWESEGDL